MVLRKRTAASKGVEVEVCFAMWVMMSQLLNLGELSPYKILKAVVIHCRPDVSTGGLEQLF